MQYLLTIFHFQLPNFVVQGEQGEMESDTEEDDLESGFEGMKSDEEESEESQDPHSSKFRATGQLLLQYEEEPSFEGYLMFKGGKRQVCVRREGVRERVRGQVREREVREITGRGKILFVFENCR